MSRLTLPNGDWADFDTRLNYAQARRVRIAQDTVDHDATFVCAIVRNWALRDKDDQPIPFPPREVDGIPLEAISLVPFDTYTQMVIFSAAQMEGVEDPKDTSETSSESSPEGRPSASRRTSQKPSSSRTILDGATPTFVPPRMT